MRRASRIERSKTLFWACALASAASAALGAGQVVTIGDLYDGGTVNLTPGDELEIRLSLRPVDCSWDVVFHDPGILKRETEAAAQTDAVFRFRAVSVGSSSLGLACRKSSDPNAPPAGLFRVSAVVKETVSRRALLLEEPDDGSEIFLTQGDTISVRLPSNPSTAYSWSIAANAPSVQQPAGDPKFEASQKRTLGGGGFQTFEFRVVGGGGAALQLVYRRPFEKEAAPARTWSVFVASAIQR